MFAVIVTGKKVLNGSLAVMAEEGQRFWVLIEDSGWVEATSATFRDKKLVPANVKTWRTRSAAVNFGKRWTGHPWWCVPNGTFEVVKLTPFYRQTLERYEAE